MVHSLQKYSKSRKMEPTLQWFVIKGIESFFNGTSLQSTAYTTPYKELVTK